MYRTTLLIQHNDIFGRCDDVFAFWAEDFPYLGAVPAGKSSEFGTGEGGDGFGNIAEHNDGTGVEDSLNSLYTAGQEALAFAYGGDSAGINPDSAGRGAI